MPDKDTVQPGDIMLFRVGQGSSWLDRAIGKVQKWIKEDPATITQEFCHAAIVGPGGNTIIEARWPRVKIGPLDLPDLLTRNPIDFYRVKDITPLQVDNVVAYAVKEIGQPYDISAIFTFGSVQLGHGLVCSQYVWKWFLNGAGLELCPYSTTISPDDLAGSSITRSLNL
jgi:uncharacterized protein YycO